MLSVEASKLANVPDHVMYNSWVVSTMSTVVGEVTAILDDDLDFFLDFFPRMIRLPQSTE